MKKVTGNLLDMFDNGDFDTIVHGCNTMHAMDGGIAYQIAKRYPEAAAADRDCWLGLGFYSTAAVLRDPLHMGLIVNAYTQKYPGRDARLFSVVKAFRRLKENGHLKGRVGIPMIGAGIGGLVWSDVELVLDRLDLGNVTVVEFG